MILLKLWKNLIPFSKKHSREETKISFLPLRRVRVMCSSITWLEESRQSKASFNGHFVNEISAKMFLASEKGESGAAAAAPVAAATAGGTWESLLPSSLEREGIPVKEFPLHLLTYVHSSQSSSALSLI